MHFFLIWWAKASIHKEDSGIPISDTVTFKWGGPICTTASLNSDNESIRVFNVNNQWSFVQISWNHHDKAAYIMFGWGCNRPSKVMPFRRSLMHQIAYQTTNMDSFRCSHRHASTKGGMIRFREDSMLKILLFVIFSFLCAHILHMFCEYASLSETCLHIRTKASKRNEHPFPYLLLFFLFAFILDMLREIASLCETCSHTRREHKVHWKLPCENTLSVFSSIASFFLCIHCEHNEHKF